MTEITITDAVRTVADRLEAAERWPHGPQAVGTTWRAATSACTVLCRGNADKGRSLWLTIVDDLGYMPHSAAVALIRASNAPQLLPDVSPDESKW